MLHILQHIVVLEVELLLRIRTTKAIIVLDIDLAHSGLELLLFLDLHLITEVRMIEHLLPPNPELLLRHQHSLDQLPRLVTDEWPFRKLQTLLFNFLDQVGYGNSDPWWLTVEDLIEDNSQ